MNQERVVTANYTDVPLARKPLPRVAMVLGNAGLTLAALTAACGGSEKNADQVSAKPDVPAAPAVVRTLEPTPAPAVKAEAPKPNTELQLPGAPEVAKSAIPAEAQLILTSLDKLTFRSPEEIEQLKKNFEVEYPKSLTATSLLKKAEPYLNLYDNLSSIYNQTTNLDYRNTIRTQRLSIEEVIKVNWPELYKSIVASGGFANGAGAK